MSPEREWTEHLTWRQRVAAVYPFLFYAVYRMNAWWYGRKTGIDKGVFLWAVLSWLPPMLALVAFGVKLGPVGGLAKLLLLGVTIAPVTGFDRFHRHWLIRRRLGTRFVDHYDRIDPIDLLWVKLFTVLFLTLYVGLLAAAVSMLPQLAHHARASTSQHAAT